MTKFNNKTKLLFVIILTVVGVYLGFQYILPLFTPFIIAYFIAWLLLPIVRFLNKKLHLPKVFGGILSVALLSAILVFAFCYFSNMFLRQLTNFFRNVPVYLAIVSGHIDNLCSGCDNIFGTKIGTIRGLFDNNMENVILIVRTEVLPAITSQSIGLAIRILGAVGIIIFTMVSILLLIKDDAEYKKSFQNSIFYSDVHKITSKLFQTGMAYLRAQAIMMIFVSIWCTSGLLLIRNKYAILIGIGIGIFDAFPVLGSGLILVPWSLVALLEKDAFSAAILLTLYLGCQIIRQILEPRLLGNRIGIKPIFTLMSMYVGAKLFGFPGFLLGPIGLVILLTIIKEMEEEIIF